MFLILAIILGLAWIAGFGLFHVASAAIHVLIVLAIIVIVVTLLIRNLQKSASGRMMSAVRTSESAASTSGISANAIKITLFAVSAGLNVTESVCVPAASTVPAAGV